jgi:hypothetical protein
MNHQNEDAAAPTHLAYALAYAARGWPVFPCNRHKKPRTENGLDDATTDAEQITRWWTGWPDANIGLRTGVMFDVLDVDAHHDGWRSLAYAVAEYGCLASSPVTSTPQGGSHFLYLPTGVGLRTNFLPGHPGLDWRGKRGYIVAPPSVGDAEPLGPARRWVAYGWSIKPSEQALEPAPPWLVELLAPKAEPRTSAPRTALRRGPRGAAYADAALRDEEAKVANAPEGERNHTLNIAALKCGQLVGAGLLDEAEVVDALGDAAIGNGMTHREVYGTAPKYHGTLDSGLCAGIASPRQVSA